MLTCLTKKANKLLDRLERDGHLLSDAEYRAAVGLLDEVIEELAVAEIEEEHEAEDRAARTRRQAPAGDLTQKSLTPDPSQRRVRYRCDSARGCWFELCTGERCKRVTDPWVLRWLRDAIPGKLTRE